MDFWRCGVAGWCLEVMFTSVDSILAGDFRLMGHTSLLMFPIYGLGAFAAPTAQFLDQWLSGLPGFEKAGAEAIPPLGRLIRHGLIYMVLIFTVEYVMEPVLNGWEFAHGTIPCAGSDKRRYPPALRAPVVCHRPPV